MFGSNSQIGSFSPPQLPTRAQEHAHSQNTMAQCPGQLYLNALCALARLRTEAMGYDRPSQRPSTMPSRTLTLRRLEPATHIDRATNNASPAICEYSFHNETKPLAESCASFWAPLPRLRKHIWHGPQGPGSSLG